LSFYYNFIIGFHFLLLHRSFGCVLQLNDLPCKASLRAEDRKGDFLTMLGTRMATVHSKVTPDAFSDNFVFFWCKEG
jgi:hypothetical protein